ncbi:MAG: hypothetical protein ACOVP1_06940 [Bacteroidia bacterium]
MVGGKSIRNKKAAETIDERRAIVSKWKSLADEVKVLPKLRDEIHKT